MTVTIAWVVSLEVKIKLVNLTLYHIFCGINENTISSINYIAITNGSVEYNPEEGSGGMINIICDEGFNLIGEEAIACDSDGTWTDTLPVCEGTYINTYFLYRKRSK